jgi:prepilin-type processing-associated H-X9-DG protein
MELLVVMAVLGILAGLLSPVLARMRVQARRAVCLSNLRQIAGAHQLYVQDWDEQYSSWTFPTHPSQARGQFPYVSWPPVAADPGAGWTQYLQPYLRSREVLRDPGNAYTAQALFPRHAEYALLTWGPGGWGTRESPYWRWAGPGLWLGAVAREAETLALVEGVTSAEVAWREAGRHGDGANVAFLDGHAGWLRTSEFERTETDGQGRYWLHYGSADQY